MLRRFLLPLVVAGVSCTMTACPNDPPGNGEGEGDATGEGEGDTAEGEGEGEGDVVDGIAIVGFGAGVRGGFVDGADTVVVDVGDDDGPGSLRDALRTGGAPRVITFAGDLDITPASALFVPSHVTIDGRGVDVRIVGKGFVLGGSDDVLLTHVSIVDVGPDTEDGVQMGAQNDPAVGVVLDHLSFLHQDGSSKNVDEAVSAVFGSHGITIQHSRFEGFEKAMLFGNGDVGADVDAALRVTVFGNVFRGTGRRHPQARFGVFDMANNLIDDWHFFDAPFLEPFPECFGAQIEDNGQLRFVNNVVTRQTHLFDDNFLSQAHDVTRCESGGVLDERGTFVRGDNGDDALAFGVGCAAGGVVDVGYDLDLAVANEDLAVALLASAGNLD